MAPTLQIHRDPGHDDGARMAMATARHSISTVPMQRSALQHCTGHVCKIVNSNLNSEILTACRTYISWINSESKFGPEKASTLNMYAIMKSGFKEVDNSQP
ncbi:hypothetical protein BDA96_09G071200 [Sorghum bicolor]|uniref:Uncharacterized protein n=2 Tax=Sorghum bicolor TaxID=4558 RepID=A0A921Q8P8_SORBI|nr:hypothetical protein BDA96_09G071200 [Sorghum bicolor]KXG21470.1 hypothetical protein SORBI_3009G067600 [Sorghum bicolor]